MSRGGWFAVAAAMLLAAAPAGAGEWQYDPATDLIFHGSVPVAQWYGERPRMEVAWPRYQVIRRAPRYQRVYRLPRHHVVRRVPRCPHGLCGYPLPIHKVSHPLPPLTTYGIVVTGHVEWCAARFRSYDVTTDTYQPYDGPRRVCRSPYG
jgi:hypothetical protein